MSSKPHKIVAIGDDRKATKEILEAHLEKWDRKIANWKPPTAWDAANQRSLKYLKRCRTATLKALAKLENREKEERHENVERNRESGQNS